jgi:hypothetical protein
MAGEPNVTVSDPSPPTNVSVSLDWRAMLNDDVKADPVVSAWAEKASEKDVPSLVKGYAHLSKRMGSAINLPGKDAKPEEVQALRQKLYESGVFQSPPKTPEEYHLKQSDHLPEGVRWSEELSKEFAGVFHKHGIPKAAVEELLPLYEKALGGAAQSLTVDREQSLAALKAEHGEKYDERVEMVKRMLNGILQTPEELEFMEATGLADHPKLLSVMLRLAPLAMQDSAFVESLQRGGGEISGEAAREEYAKIISDPTHAMHGPLMRRDKKAEAYVDELYRKAYGTEKVRIGEGVSV